MTIPRNRRLTEKMNSHRNFADNNPAYKSQAPITRDKLFDVSGTGFNSSLQSDKIRVTLPGARPRGWVMFDAETMADIAAA